MMTHPTRLLTFFAAFLLAGAFGCSTPDPPDDTPNGANGSPNNASNTAPNGGSPPVLEDDTKISFSAAMDSDGGTGNVPDPLHLCDVQGPHNTVIIGRVVEDPVRHPLADGCDPDDDPYARGHYKLGLETVGHVSGPDVPSPVTLVTWGSLVEGTIVDPSHGDTILAGLRKSGDTWFVDFWIYADVMGSDVGAQPTGDTQVSEMPTTWAGLVRESKALSADYVKECGKIPTGHRGMEDGDYHDWRYVRPVPKPGCEPDDDAGHDVYIPPDMGSTPSADAGDAG